MNTIMTIGSLGTSVGTGTPIGVARPRVTEPAVVARTWQSGLPVVHRAALPKLVDNSTGVSVSGSRRRT